VRARVRDAITSDRVPHTVHLTSLVNDMRLLLGVGRHDEQRDVLGKRSAILEKPLHAHAVTRADNDARAHVLPQCAS
jgi:hypothetical protein